MKLDKVCGGGKVKAKAEKSQLFLQFFCGEEKSGVSKAGRRGKLRHRHPPQPLHPLGTCCRKPPSAVPPPLLLPSCGLGGSKVRQLPPRRKQTWGTSAQSNAEQQGPCQPSQGGASARQDISSLTRAVFWSLPLSSSRYLLAQSLCSFLAMGMNHSSHQSGKWFHCHPLP